MSKYEWAYITCVRCAILWTHPHAGNQGMDRQTFVYAYKVAKRRRKAPFAYLGTAIVSANNPAHVLHCATAHEYPNHCSHTAPTATYHGQDCGQQGRTIPKLVYFFIRTSVQNPMKSRFSPQHGLLFYATPNGIAFAQLTGLAKNRSA